MYVIYRKLNFYLFIIVAKSFAYQLWNKFYIEFLFYKMYNVFRSQREKGFYSKKEYFYAYETKQKNYT